MPTTSTIIGYVASGLVLTTFWTNDLRRLRMLAILSNIAFISYGALVWLPPVLGLHLLLLPLNTARLMRMSKTPPEGRPPQPSANVAGSYSAHRSVMTAAFERTVTQPWRKTCLLQYNRPSCLAAGCWLRCDGVSLAKTSG